MTRIFPKSLFRHVTIPHSTPRLRLVVPIVRIMLKSLANDWAKRRSAATVCVYEIGFDCCLHLKIAKYSSTPGPPSPRTGHHNYCPLVNHDGRQLAGGRNRISWIPVNHMRLCVRSRLWHIPCLHQKATTIFKIEALKSTKICSCLFWRLF